MPQARRSGSPFASEGGNRAYSQGSDRDNSSGGLFQSYKLCVDLESRTAPARALSRRRDTLKGRTSWCSQILSTFQPALRNCTLTLLSRSRLRWSFGPQYDLFCFGGLEQRGQQCQKQPSMNTATLGSRKTKSGRPGSSWCRRQPVMWAPRRISTKRNSVLAFPRERIEVIIFDRFSGDSSTASFSLLKQHLICSYFSPASCTVLNRENSAAYEFGNRRGNCVADEPPSSTVQPSGNPISFSHSFQVKFLAT